MSVFQKAVRTQRKAKVALDGPPGSGKTYSGLRLAYTLSPNGRVAVIDTEHSSASLYAGESPDGRVWDFGTLPLTQCSPDAFARGVETAIAEGYEALVIDSLSHAWIGRDGVLELVDRVAGNKFTNGWKDVTPMHRHMMDTILGSNIHVIATMRTKMEYVVELNEKGKAVPRKVGMAPVQREGTEYEFDVIGDMDFSHMLTINKSRCIALKNAKCLEPGPQFWTPLVNWLNSATPTPATNGRATPEQCGRFSAGLIARNVHIDVATMRLQQAYGVEFFDQLTPSQAEEILAKLEG